MNFYFEFESNQLFVETSIKTKNYNAKHANFQIIITSSH